MSSFFVHPDVYDSDGDDGDDGESESIRAKDIGQNSPRWKAFLADFKSAKQYSERVNDFACWLKPDFDISSLADLLFDYFEFRHKETDQNIGNPRYSASTFRSWYSIFVSFWKHSNKGNLDELNPTISHRIVTWGKNHVTKKAAVFTKEDLGKFEIYPSHLP